MSGNWVIDFIDRHPCQLHPAFGWLSIALRHGDPNQAVSASRNPVSVPSPTQATCPSGRISTEVGAVTAPSTGSSQTPAYLALISGTRSPHGVMLRTPG